MPTSLKIQIGMLLFAIGLMVGLFLETDASNKGRQRAVAHCIEYTTVRDDLCVMIVMDKYVIPSNLYKE